VCRDMIAILTLFASKRIRICRCLKRKYINFGSLEGSPPDIELAIGFHRLGREGVVRFFGFCADLGYDGSGFGGS
jgi:hypothetical protein